jgi:hypothetical protein
VLENLKWPTLKERTNARLTMLYKIKTQKKTQKKPKKSISRQNTN